MARCTLGAESAYSSKQRPTALATRREQDPDIHGEDEHCDVLIGEICRPQICERFNGDSAREIWSPASSTVTQALVPQALLGCGQRHGTLLVQTSSRQLGASLDRDATDGRYRLSLLLPDTVLSHD